MPKANLTNITIKKLQDKNFNDYYVIVNNDNQDEAYFCFEKTVKDGWDSLINNYQNIKEVDLAQILSEFLNLKYLNLDYNPLSAKNLENLTSQQLEKLITGMKDKKIRINSSKGTILADLLDYTQQLIKKGGNNTQNAYKLQALIQQQNSPVQPTNKKDNNSPYTPLILIIGGIVLISFGLLAGYLWGKRRKGKLDL